MLFIRRSSTSAALAVALAATLLLAGCDGDKSSPNATDDPALKGALGDQIVIDPNLAKQKRPGDGRAASAQMSPADRSPEAIAAAKTAANRLAGGRINPAPAATTGNGATGGFTPAQLAAWAPAGGAGTNCPDKVEYAAAWAMRLPAALTVYPRGRVIEAAGTDRDGCHLRVVNFVTPVAVQDVLDFYATRAGIAGFDVEHTLQGGDHVLGGTKDAAAYMLYARKLTNGLTEVDLIANGE